MRAAADAAALQVKMNSLKRQQELDWKQELLKHQQMELKRLEEKEHLQGELEAAKARRDTLEKLLDKTSFKAIEDLGSNVSETNSQRQENEKPERNGELLDNIASVSMSQGGVWERQIRTIRSVLTALLEKNRSQLNDEALQTFVCKAEAVVNSRPLTTGNTTSSASPEALMPNHFLTMKTKIILPLPGVFQDADKYSRRQWRRVQHLTNKFWTRWRKEFLHALQERQNRVRPRRNMQAGDVVLIKNDNTPVTSGN